MSCFPILGGPNKWLKGESHTYDFQVTFVDENAGGAGLDGADNGAQGGSSVDLHLEGDLLATASSGALGPRIAPPRAQRKRPSWQPPAVRSFAVSGAWRALCRCSAFSVSA